MKKLFLFLFATMTLSFISCEKNKDINEPEPEPEPTPFSIVGKWVFSQFDYYFDGELLPVHDSVIYVWQDYHGHMEPCGMVCHGKVEFYADSTGLVIGIGEYETDSVDFTYSKVKDKYVVSVSGGLTTVEFERDSLDNDILVNRDVIDDAYGWESLKEHDSRKQPQGYDGKNNHTLVTVAKLKRM